MKKCLSGLLVFLPLILIACDQGTDPGPGNGKDTLTDPKDTLTNPKDTLTNPTDTLTVQLDTTVYRNTDSNYIRRAYEPLRGRVQITGIYFDQDSNHTLYGLRDEWVVLESNMNLSTAGWKLDADDGQQYPLPPMIYRKLYIYTMAGPGYENDTIKTWNRGSNRWVWNNTEPDTGRILDASGKVVDFITYKAKR